MRDVIDRLRADVRGSPALQFALVLPVMLMLIMGLGELTFQTYVQSVLTGAVQKAGRDSTIQGASTQTDTIDAAVQAVVQRVVPSGTFTSTRANYDNYSAIAGEPFTDSPYPSSSGTYDGVCNHGETYVDVNNNGHYDLDLSTSGQGGANDVTKYTMTVTYRRLFPVGFIGWSQNARLSATTILKNQPYASQVVNSGTNTGTCS